MFFKSHKWALHGLNSSRRYFIITPLGFVIPVRLDVEDESIEPRRWNSNYTVWKRCLKSLRNYAREKTFSKFLSQCVSVATDPFDAAPKWPRVGPRRGFHEGRRNTDQWATLTLLSPANREGAITNYQKRRVKSPWNYLRPELEKKLDVKGHHKVVRLRMKRKENCIQSWRK